MKKLYGFFIVFMLIFFSSCNPKVTTTISKSYTPLDYKQDVVVIGLNQSAPKNSEVLGQVKIGDTGFSKKCSYDIVVDKAKLEARKVGGNAIKIVKHIPPSMMGSSCHRITANILKVGNVDSLVLEEQEEELLDIDHAIFYVYRPSGPGFLVSYDLHLGDKVICRVKNNYKQKIRIYNDGLNSIWAKTESKAEVPIKVEIGKEYYIRCGIKMGAIVGRPSIDLVDKATGKNEYQSITGKDMTKDVIIRTNGDRVECEILEEDDEMVYFNIEMNGNIVKTQIEKEKIEKIEYAE